MICRLNSNMKLLVFLVVACSFCHAALAITGKASFYDANGEGNCCFIKDTSSPLMITALSSDYWNGAANCGRCVKVTNTDNQKTIVVKIIDKCPTCPGQGIHLDLSRDAFGQLAEHSKGIIPISYDYVPCPTSGNIIYRVKDSSTLDWMSVVVNNHKVGVKKFEVKGSGGNWVEATRADYNEFEVNAGGISLPISFRVTSINDEVITDENIINNNQLPGQYTSSGQFTADTSSSSSPAHSSSHSPVPSSSHAPVPSSSHAPHPTSSSQSPYVPSSSNSPYPTSSSTHAPSSTSDKSYVNSNPDGASILSSSCVLLLLSFLVLLA